MRDRRRGLAPKPHAIQSSRRIGYGDGFEELFEMAFIICDDHNLDVEADGIENADAKHLMLIDTKPGATATEKEIIDFGIKHRHCNIRILAG
jgi:hypothetical protein